MPFLSVRALFDGAISVHDHGLVSTSFLLDYNRTLLLRELSTVFRLWMSRDIIGAAVLSDAHNS